MVQELDLIVDLLREMKRANSTNSQSFDNLLAGINSKVDVMGRNTASAELLKACLSELTKNLDDRYSTTLSRLSEIEKALNVVFKAQNEHVKNKEFMELFDKFSTTLNNFYSDSRQQKSILNGIEARLSDISTDKSDKEDILRTISLLRNDFENLNHNYKRSIDGINSDLKAVLSNMTKADKVSITKQISEQVQVMYKATGEIVNYLNAIDKRDANLEKILANVATNESLKLTQGFIDSIIEKSEEISARLTTLADKSDISDLRTATGLINEVVTKELFTKITSETETLISQTDDIKKTLAHVTRNIDAQPDTRMFEDALQNLFKNFESLSQDINKLDYAENISEIDTRINVIANELSIIKHIAADINEAVMSRVLTAIEDISFENESSDIKTHISNLLSELPQKEDIDRILANDLFNRGAVETLIDKTDKIADMLDTLPTYEDMEKLSNNQLNLIDNLQDVASKSDIENLEAKADEIEEMIDNLNFDDEFENIYDKAMNIENWLVESMIKEKSDEILSQFTKKANQTDIIEILSTSKKIANDLEELSQNTDAKKVNRTVSEVYSMIDELKNDFINTTEMHNDSIIVALSELQNSATNIVTVEEFNSFAEDLKTFVETLAVDLESLKTGTSEVDKSIAEIKKILVSKQGEFSEYDSVNNKILANIESYISELKTVIDTSDSNSEIMTKISKIEDDLAKFKSINEESLQQIVSRLEKFGMISNLSDSESSSEFESSILELTEIKNQIKALGDSFNSLNFGKSTNEGNISEFISNKLEELSQDFEAQVNQGFIQNTELIEEKTELLHSLIKDLRHTNSGNIDMYERLTVADNKLIDFKQELELVNTDIVNAVNEKLNKELNPIKELLSNMLANIVKINFSDMAQPLEDVQNSVAEIITDNSTLDKIEDIYTKISNEIIASESGLKDYVLGEIDSVIIKIDSIKEDLDNSISAIAPPDYEKMKEFSEFASQINDFRKSQQEFYEKLSANISETISEQFTTQTEDLKSLLAVCDNKSAILDAIEDLKINLRNFINTSSLEDDFATNEYEKAFEADGSIEQIKTEFDKFAEVMSNLTEQNQEIKDVLNSLKDKLETSAATQSAENSEFDIADENSDIAEFLSAPEKSSNFDIIKALDMLKEDIENLNQDINNMDWLEEIKNYLAGNEIKTMLAQINNKIDVLAMSDNTDWIEDIKQVIEDLNQTDLNEIQESNTQIQSVLELINEKIDILATSDSTDWIEDIKQVIEEVNQADLNEIQESNTQIQSGLELINKKIDILATSDNSTDFEDIKDTLESIESKLNSQEEPNIENKLSESDAKITSMLEALNHKIDILASYDDTETQFALEDVKALILEQKDSLDKLDNNNNTDAFKKCLDELTLEVNNITSNNSQEIQKTLKEMKESIMAAVVTIFEQVSFIEESEDIKDFVEEKTDEINKNLIEVTEQLKQIANTDNDYTYSMQDIESDLAKLRIALNELQSSEQDAKTEQLSFILDNINRIGSTVENLQSSMTKEEEFSDLKTKLNEIAETSGESYNTIGKILTDQLSTKVDRVTKLIERSNDSDKVMRQALIYIGEWIDSTSESMNKISTNSDEIVDIKLSIENLKSVIPQHTNILNSIEEKFDEQQERLAYFEKQITKLGNLEDRFEQQQERIDRLEMSLEKILSAVEDIDDSKVTRKIDKIDKQLVKLSSNIEKLASYVD